MINIDKIKQEKSINELLELMQEIEEKTQSIDKGLTIILNANNKIKEQAIQSKRHKIKRSKKEIILEQTKLYND